MKYIFYLIVFVGIGHVLNAQQRPFINSINPTNGVPGETLVITGSGFNPGNMQVNIGNGVAVVNNSTSTLLEVTIPTTATYGQVTALNLSTGLIGKSSQYFSPMFFGGEYDPATAATQVDFTTEQQYAYDLCACDFDGDGQTDVAVANNTGTSVSIFKNNSTFNTPSFVLENIANGFETINTECGDLNGDGKADLVFTTNTGSASSHVFVYRNTSSVGNISFTKTEFRLPRVEGGQNRIPRKFEIVDIDGDGRRDLIIGNEEDNTLLIYRNNSATGGVIRFFDPLELEVLDAEWAGVISVADFNNDGLNDIATIANALNTSTIYILQNTGSPGNLSFQQKASIGSSKGRINIISADLTGDLLPEIISSSSINDEIEIFTNESNGGEIQFNPTPTIFNADGAWGIRVADVSGDGLPDLVSSSRSSSLFVLENQGTDLTFELHEINTERDNRNLRVFDVDGDAKPDMVFVSRSEQTAIGNMSVVLNQNCLAPTISPENLTFCRDSPFTLSATKAYNATYLWEIPTGNGTIGANGNETVDITVTSGTSVDVKVTITSGTGNCVDEITQTFTMTGGTPPTAPGITITQEDPPCSGTDFTLTGPTGRDSYLWILPDGTQTSTETNSLTITNSSSDDAGIYKLRTQQSGSCVSDEATITVSVDEPPNLTIRNTGEDRICNGTSVELVVPEFPGFSYQWIKDGENRDGATDVNYSATESGNYAVRLTADNSGCVKISDSYEIEVVNAPVTSFELAEEVCVGVATDIVSNSTGQDDLTLNYNWSLSDGTTLSGEEISHTFDSPGNYSVTLNTSYDELSSCVSTEEENILISAAPRIGIDTPEGDEKCPSDSLRLEINDTRVVNYNWSTGDTGNFTYAKTDISEDQAAVSVTLLTDVGCEITSEIEISNYQNSRIFISSPDATISEGAIQLEDEQSTITLLASNGSEYLWSPAEIFDDSTASEVKAFPKNPSTKVIVTGIDQVNQCETSDSLTILTPGVIARKSFSPNGDGMGFDCWEILNTSNLNGCTVYIFDQRGAQVFKGDSPFANDCVWNGNVDNGSKQVPEGVYYFVMKCDDNTYDRSGAILLGR